MAMSSRSSRLPSVGEHLVGGLLDDRRARVVVLVDPVAEAHQLDAVLLVLDPLDERRRRRRRRRGSSSSISSTAWLAPPCSGPNSALMPAETEANRLACDEPTSRTVDVEQFCSWSACRMSSRSSACDHRRVDLVRLGREAERHPQEVLDQAERVVRVEERLADRLLVGVGRDRRQLGQQPDGRQLAPARGRTGRASPGRRSTAPTTAEDSTGIGCASRGKPSKKRLRSSCSSVCRRIWSVELVELRRRSAARRRSAGSSVSRNVGLARPAASIG